jgi:hypothetical protein
MTEAAVEIASAPQAVEVVKIVVLPSGKVDRKNTAKAVNRIEKTLSEWARLGIGPKPQNIQGRIFYDWAEVQAFMGATAA